MKPWQVFVLALLLPLAALPALLRFFSAPVPDPAAGLQAVTVDLPAVIADMARYRADTGDPQRANHDAVVINNSLQVMVQQHGLLLAPGAVLAGAEDATGELRLRLQQAGLLPVAAIGTADALP